MNDTCKNCGKPIRVMAFRGEGWCSDLCRKALVQKMTLAKARQKCTYEDRWTDEVGSIPVCIVHDNNSKYPPSRGEHRPCLSVEPY